jgi:hypothetical protein
MTSRRLTVVAALIAATGCGRAHDLSVASDPLLVIHGHVDVAHLTRVDASAPLIGSLVWAGVAAVNPVCLEYTNAQIKPACPDPYGVFAAEIERAAPIDANGDFDLTLFHLPNARVSIGNQSTRIAYGSLLVLEDSNGDGQPTFPGGVRRRDEDDEGPPPVSNPDRIVAASFYSLQAPQKRVVFREGGFVDPSNFYPQDCGAPPPGFSILTAPAYTGMPAAAGDCAFDSTDVRVNVDAVNPQDPAEGLGLLCRPVQRDATVQQPQGDEGPSGRARKVCLDSNVLAAVFSGLCFSLRSYALRGCAQAVPTATMSQCSPPEWDLTASPPPWWPCH